MTTKQNNKNSNVNPFAIGTVVWQGHDLLVKCLWRIPQKCFYND